MSSPAEDVHAERIPPAFARAQFLRCQQRVADRAAGLSFDRGNRVVEGEGVCRTYMAAPSPKDIPHLEEILSLIVELRCKMYDNALVPVALANKLVSLSDFPSQRVLGTFARATVGKERNAD